MLSRLWETRKLAGREVESRPKYWSPFYYILVGLNYTVGLILEGPEEADREYRKSVNPELDHYFPIKGKSIYYHDTLGRFQALEYAPKRIKRLYSLIKDYGPVLFYDFDLDWIYILKLLRVKLKRTADALERGNLLNSPKRAKDIKHLVYLIDRIVADDYMEYHYKREKELYGELEMDFKPTDDPNLSSVHIDRPGARLGSQEYLDSHKRSKKAYEHAEYMRQQDIDYVFETMRKHLQFWWD